MSKVKSIMFNWFQCGSTIDRDGAGENYNRLEVRKNAVNGIVISIEENQPTGGNEVWNYLVHFEDGSSSRIFNANYVEYFPVEPKIPEFPKDRVGSNV